MNFVVVTGMSGAGKTTALKFLEDIGFFCVDNLPSQLINKFTEICLSANSEIKNIAVGVDIRSSIVFDNLLENLNNFLDKSFNYNILFLDSNNDVLLKRYKETRRNHPLAKNGRLITGIEKEREILTTIKIRANYVIDTSFILNRQLKEQIIDIFVNNIKFDNLMINILSFGFKYGIPSDSDLVFDVRFIPNPYYIKELKFLTGNDKEVKDYVLSWNESNEFIYKIKDLLDFLIPNYIREGKNQLVISIGCTGGKHRSVTIANELIHLLSEKMEHCVIINHRDIHKDNKGYGV